ncbi:MAG: anion permease [Clostridia bacterium]|nr:anion permease [Clostridia bacterium]
MVVALILFIITYILMMTFQTKRHIISVASALVFVVLGYFGLWELDIFSALGAVDYNVLLMIGGTMGTVSLFIESKMPQRLSEMIITKVPNVMWAVAMLSLFAGVVSAFVDNVATVLMIAPIGLAICKKINISPIPVLICIAVSSNLQGAATLVGDTTSIILGGAANMNFLDFFFMNGRPGMFFATELGALVSLLIVFFLFRKEKEPIQAKIETVVEDYVPSYLMILTVVLLIVASFIPEPADVVLQTIWSLRNGIICVLLCVIGIIYECVKKKNSDSFKLVISEMDKDTLLILFGLFIIIAGITSAGVIDVIAGLFYNIAGDNPFVLYTLIVFISVALSAFIDNIPYVTTMLPVVSSLAVMMGVEPLVFYFGLLIGATLGGNLTPIGASANITAIGILRKNGYEVKNSDFLKIGVPFTLAAVITGYLFIWAFWHV